MIAPKKLYKLIRPVMINGVESSEVYYRDLTVGDLRRINKGNASNQVVRMISLSCGISPDDVDNFKSRDLMTLRKLIVGDMDSDDSEDEETTELFELNDDDQIIVELNQSLKNKEGNEVKQIVLEELTTAQTLQTEKRAKGDSFEMIYNRVKASAGLDSEVLDQMSKDDFKRVQSAVSVFFMAGEAPDNI